MIAIVGAGLTGLALSRELRRAGVEHVVLEAADRPGGVIRSGRVQGRLLEWGPQRARLTADLRVIVDELGLADRLITAPSGLPLHVYTRGRLRLVPFTLAQLLATDLLSAGAKARLLLEPLTGPARGDERVAHYLTRKLGREAYENLAGPLYGGLYASDPADMMVGLSLAHALRELGVGRSLLLPLLRRGGRIAPPPAVSFVDGLQTLTDALHAAAGDVVRLGTRVAGIRMADDRLVLTCREGDVPADRVVLTTPAADAARLLRDLDAAAAERIGSLRYNPLAVVHLASGADLRGLGYQVRLGEDLVTRGVTFNHALFGREGLYTAYLGGARSPEVQGWPDDAVADAAVDEFRQVTGCDSEVVSVARVAMPAWDLSWRALEGLRIPSGIEVAASWWSRPGIPGRLAEARRLAGSLAPG